MPFNLFFFFNSNIFLATLFILFFNNMYMNNLSMYMIFMSFIMMKMIYFSFKEKMNLMYFSMKKKIMNFLFIFLIMFFSSYKLVLMYILFEMISLMIFILIFFSSFSMMRMKSSIYMFLFMSLGTFPMFVMVFYMSEKVFLMIFILSFTIKIPIMFFHLWLPKAHVEANFYDSMILASLLLKLGGYGLLIMDLNMNFDWIIFWSMLTVLMFSFMVLFYMDMKVIMAMSSIIHMNMMILLWLSNSFVTEKSISMIMVSHALVSSLMFFLVGLIYEQSFSRNLMINKSFMINYMYFFLVMFMILLMNMGTPPFMTFFSELYMYMHMINSSLNFIFLLMLMIFLSILFNLIILKNLSMMVMNKFFKLFSLKLNSIIIIKEHFFYLIYFM